MKINYYGASRIVTGSAFLVETGDSRFLVDCGMFQGSKIVKELNYGDFPYNPETIDSVILTHAHIDHSGLIPKLVKKGFRGKVYATPETIEFCSIMLPDSGYIQEMEVERKNRKRTRADLPPLEAIYTAEDAHNSLKYFVPVEYDRDFIVTETVSARFVNAGHILGSAQVILTVKEEDKSSKIVFSGDIGTTNQPFIEDPDLIKDADLVIMETTYGSRVHTDKVGRLDSLAEVINEANARGGNIIIPAFAIERTQDVLYYLQELQAQQKIPVLPIYIDSPLAIAATKIFRTTNTDNFDEETINLINKGYNPLTMENLRFSETTEESIALNSITGGTIIISASGMADAGRIKHHLKHNLWRPNATVIFVGYQAEGTLGRRLVDGEKEVTIHGEKIAVNANIAQLPGFSAHADQTELLHWVKTAGGKARQIIFVHGEEESMKDFSSLVKQELGKEPLIPVLGESIEFRGDQVIRTVPERPWLEVMEERLAARLAETEGIERPVKCIPERKYSRQKRILLSEVNHIYLKVRKNLKMLVDAAKKEKDYSALLETFNKINKILEDARKNY